MLETDRPTRSLASLIPPRTTVRKCRRVIAQQHENGTVGRQKVGLASSRFRELFTTTAFRSLALYVVGGWVGRMFLFLVVLLDDHLSPLFNHSRSSSCNNWITTAYCLPFSLQQGINKVVSIEEGQSMGMAGDQDGDKETGVVVVVVEFVNLAIVSSSSTAVW